MSRKAAARLPFDEPVVRPTFARERAAMKRGVFPVAGCDEAGRGPLAGPVVAAAVILDPRRIPKGLNDSKKLNAEQRNALYEKICSSAEVAVAIAPPARIESLNIRGAFLHVLGDTLSSVGVLAGAAVIAFTGWGRVDLMLELNRVIVVRESVFELVLIQGVVTSVPPTR